MRRILTIEIELVSLLFEELTQLVIRRWALKVRVLGLDVVFVLDAVLSRLSGHRWISKCRK